MKQLLITLMLIVAISSFSQNKTNVLNRIFINKESNDTIEIYASHNNISITSSAKKQTNTYYIQELFERNNVMNLITLNGPIIKYSMINPLIFIGHVSKNKSGVEVTKGEFYKKIKTFE